MKAIQRFYWAHLLVAVSILAAGYALAGLWVVSLAILAAGGVWLVAQRGGAARLAGLFLYGLFAAAGLGTWLGIPAWLAVIACVAAVGAWDLDHFLQRLNTVERVDYHTGVGRAHLRRLAVVEALGCLAGVLASVIHLRLAFIWEVLLAALAVAGIAGIIRYMREANS